jgi:dienelactone hydrolase
VPRPKLLLHSGAKDDANEDIATLIGDLETLGADYEVSRYGPGVLHSFTEWEANTPGMAMYDQQADERSWAATVQFFQELFATGVSPVQEPTGSVDSAKFMEADVDYEADGVACRGYMIYDKTKCSARCPCPAVVVVQDWDGMNDYEKHRARVLAEAGYVAFAADIYGVDTPVENMQDFIAASSAHQQDSSLFLKKIHGAVAKAIGYDVVDANNLAAVGYCFGGNGMVRVALGGHSVLDPPFPAGLKGVVSYHGGITNGYGDVNDAATSRPKLLYLASGADTSTSIALVNGLTDALEGVSANYQVGMYGPGIGHGFTHWGGASYDARADMRSWSATMDFLNEIFDLPLCDPADEDEDQDAGQAANNTGKMTDAAFAACSPYHALLLLVLGFFV